MGMTAVPPVKLYSISCQKPSHDHADWRKARAQQQVSVILGIKAHAKQSVCVSISTCPSRFTKESRSSSSQKIFRRSIPRIIIRCNAPAASILAFRGMSVPIAAKLPPVNQYINTRPYITRWAVRWAEP
jgi:hypothetical protein